METKYLPDVMAFFKRNHYIANTGNAKKLLLFNIFFIITVVAFGGCFSEKQKVIFYILI